MKQSETNVPQGKMLKEWGISRTTLHRWKKRRFIPETLNETQVKQITDFLRSGGDIRMFHKMKQDEPSDETDVSQSKTNVSNDETSDETKTEKELRERVKSVVSHNETLLKQIETKDKQIDRRDKQIDTLHERLREQNILLKEAHERPLLPSADTPHGIDGTEYPAPVGEGSTNMGTKVLIATMLLLVVVLAVWVVMVVSPPL